MQLQLICVQLAASPLCSSNSAVSVSVSGYPHNVTDIVTTMAQPTAPDGLELGQSAKSAIVCSSSSEKRRKHNSMFGFDG